MLTVPVNCSCDPKGSVGRSPPWAVPTVVAIQSVETSATSNVSSTFFGERRRERIGGVVGVVESYDNGSEVVHQANDLDKYSSTTRRTRAPPIGATASARTSTTSLSLLCLSSAQFVRSYLFLVCTYLCAMLPHPPF